MLNSIFCLMSSFPRVQGAAQHKGYKYENLSIFMYAVATDVCNFEGRDGERLLFMC